VQDQWLEPRIDLAFGAVTSVVKPVLSEVCDFVKLNNFVILSLPMALLTFCNLEVKFLLDLSEVLENVLHLRQ
jgi:hypothetical protein